MVLYYKADSADLDSLTKEEMEEGKEDIKMGTKEECWDELASEPSDPPGMKSLEDQEGHGKSQDQDGKKEDNKDEDNSDSCPEASEENNPLKLSKNKKVTTATGSQVGNGLVPYVRRVLHPSSSAALRVLTV